MDTPLPGEGKDSKPGLGMDTCPVSGKGVEEEMTGQNGPLSSESFEGTAVKNKFLF